MPGHVFVMRGDLTAVECDAWLLPCSEGLYVEPYWTSSASGPVLGDLDGGVLRRTPPSGWSSEGVRTFRLDDWWEDDGPETWVTNVGGGRRIPVPWFVDGVEQFVESAARDLRDRKVSARNRRAKHLLALPLVGTGHGGGAARKGEIVGQLVPALETLAGTEDVDIALVAWDAQAFAAAQGVRRRPAATEAAARRWPDLSTELIQAAARLAGRAVAGDLVLFLGAGVSAAAGLPLWQGLLDRLALAAGLEDAELRQLGKLDVLDQARLLQGRFDEQGESLGKLVATLVEGRRYALTHGLIASLPSREVVTVNYDKLFEHASTAADEPPVVLPYDDVQVGARWLLKLHGSVDHPEDIVLTRSDYLRYSDRRAALAGIVQALLITRHMLFIGFSLTDDNFNRIAEDVRRAIRGEVAPDEPQLGTALLLHEDPMMVELWKHDLTCVPMDGPSDTPDPSAARRLEIFLDCLLAFASTNASHVMDPSFQALLTDEEQELRGLLEGLDHQASDELRGSPMWTPIQELLDRFGQGSGDRHA